MDEAGGKIASVESMYVHTQCRISVCAHTCILFAMCLHEQLWKKKTQIRKHLPSCLVCNRSLKLFTHLFYLHSKPLRKQVLLQFHWTKKKIKALGR